MFCKIKRLFKCCKACTFKSQCEKCKCKMILNSLNETCLHIKSFLEKNSSSCKSLVKERLEDCSSNINKNIQLIQDLNSLPES